MECYCARPLMDDLEQLAHCQALYWTELVWRDFLSRGQDVPPDWPGSVEQARLLVAVSSNGSSRKITARSSSTSCCTVPASSGRSFGASTSPAFFRLCAIIMDWGTTAHDRCLARR